MYIFLNNCIIILKCVVDLSVLIYDIDNAKRFIIKIEQVNSL